MLLDGKSGLTPHKLAVVQDNSGVAVSGYFVMAEASSEGMPQQYHLQDLQKYSIRKKNVAYRACQESWFKTWPW